MSVSRVVMPFFVASVIALGAMTHASATTAPIQPQAPAMQEIEIKATKYEFTPGKIEVALNSSVRFKVTAADHDHGFEIEGVKDSCAKIKKGETATIEYKALKAGTFKFKCCDRCGLGHGRMSGTLVVK